MLRPRHRVYGLARAGAGTGRLIAGCWTFGGPGGLQTLLEFAAFTLFITLVGGLGKTGQAATILAFTVNSVAWVPMMGVGTAVSAMVGQQLGSNRPNLAPGHRTACPRHALYVGDVPVRYGACPAGSSRGMPPACPEQFDRCAS